MRMLNALLLGFIEREVARQSSVLVDAGAFDAETAPDELPTHIAAAADVVSLARRMSVHLERLVGYVSGGTFGALGGIAIGLAESPFAGVVAGVLAGAASGFLFRRAMRPFTRYVVLPVRAGEVQRWRDAARAVGYRAGGRDGNAYFYTPGPKLGVMSGRLLVAHPDGEVAFVAGPSGNVARLVERMSSMPSRRAPSGERARA